MGSGGSSQSGQINDVEQVENGGGDPTQHGEIIDTGDSAKLIFFLIVQNAPASGTCTVTVQESPDYGIATEGAETWMTLGAFDAIDVGDADTYIQRLQFPNATINSWGRYVRVVAQNSVADQVCLFSVTWRGYA